MRRYVLLALALLATTVIAAPPAPIIFHGNYGKLLPKGGLEFSQDSKLLADLTADPTVGAGSVASIGSIGMLNDGGTGKVYVKTGAGDTSWTQLATGAGSGDVVGPASATDNALVRFDSTTGKLIQNSGATLSDVGLLTTDNVILSSLSANTVPYLNGSKQLTSSSVTPTQLGYVDATSSIQTQLDTKMSNALADGKIFVGSAGGVATAQTVSGDITLSNAGVGAISTGVIVNDDVNASAAIAYSKLNLANSIVNADIAAGASIVYAKLNLTAGITNSDIAGDAAIGRSKLGTDNANEVVINSGTGTFASEPQLALSRGGTAKNLTLVTGGVLWGDNDSLEITAGGSTGQLLQSNGASAPSWLSLSSVDHGGLGGLTDDDHSQYGLLAGRGGGQTLTGGTAASNNLTLRSTSDGSKGTVKLDETTVTTSATTGALVVDGGIGVGGSLYVGSGIRVDGTTKLATSLSGALSASEGTVSAGTLSIANGGTSQTTASGAFGALSPLAVKGDLLGFSTINGALPVGTNDQVLTADSTATYGFKWATSSAGGGSYVGGCRWVAASSCQWSRTSTSSWADYSADTDCTSPSGANLFGSGTAPATKVPGCTFASLASGDYLVFATGAFDASAGCSWRLYNGSVASGIQTIQTSGSVGNILGVFENMSGTTTFTVQATGNNTSAQCDINANVTGGIRDLDIHVFKF